MLNGRYLSMLMSMITMVMFGVLYLLVVSGIYVNKHHNDYYLFLQYFMFNKSMPRPCQQYGIRYSTLGSRGISKSRNIVTDPIRYQDFVDCAPYCCYLSFQLQKGLCGTKLGIVKLILQTTGSVSLLVDDLFVPEDIISSVSVPKCRCWYCGLNVST